MEATGHPAGHRLTDPETTIRCDVLGSVSRVAQIPICEFRREG